MRSQAAIIVRVAAIGCGVAVLILTAALLAQRRPTAATPSPAPVQEPQSAALWVSPRVAAESAAVSASLGALDRVTETRVRSGSRRTNAAFNEAGASFDREMRAYLTAMRAFAAPAALAALAAREEDHLSRAAALARNADRRRELSREYAATLAIISAQVHGAMDGSWKLFGRVLMRPSLLDLDRALDSIWLQSQRLTTADPYDRSAFDALNASHARFASLLETHAGELARIAGPSWLTRIRLEVDRLRSLCAGLQAIERRAPAELASFHAEEQGLVGAINALDRALPMRSGSRASDRIRGGGNPPAVRAGARQGRLLLGMNLAVLIAILFAMTATFGSARPPRRLIAAMRKLARGEAVLPADPDDVKQPDVLRPREEYDSLTQLPNRRHLLTHLRQAVERAHWQHKRLAVLIVDLDHFKTLNDGVDHDFGDRALIAISHRVCEVAGPMSFVARLGGDEFAVVHELAGDAAATNDVGLRLLQAFSMPLRVDGHELSMGISVGASVFPDHAETAEGLLRAADAALSQAKASGRSQQVHFSPAFLEDASVRFRVEQGLRRAIDRGELELHFQPEVSLANQSTTVLEALVRWRMADGTLVAPGRFLPVAEQSGLILEIGDWVIRRAVATVAAWYRSGLTDVRVAINVSARQLLAPGFANRIMALLESERLPASCIELELTENALQTDPATVDVLRALRAEDIALALDDFGAGYSSLASLEHLPLSRVKLDRTLIADIHTSARSLAIARSIIGLCRKLELEVTAEGVQDLYQLAVLLPEESVLVQGFLIGRPAPEPDALILMRTMRDRMTALLRQATLLSRDSAAVRQGYVSRARTARRRQVI
ncbi:MAG TPA: EAL domain-containing protein [Steroidobacteraceae bacterium]|nr:EAL domain-containing protein [Steroidobacteraceae bacterium]